MNPKVGIVQIPCDIEFQKIMKTLTLAAKDNQLHGLILIIDNDGGDIGQFSALHDLIKKITTIKPVIGLVCGNACSSGYWIASATSYLYCSSASDIGSIGSFLEIEKYSDQRLASNEKNTIEAKIDYEIFTAATYKTIHNVNAPLSETQRTYLQNKVKNTYFHLINSISKNRSLSIDNHLDWADAKMFLGHEAVELGLVDSVGTILDAEVKVLELIKQKFPDTIFDSSIETVELN
jgi:protease-4